MKVVKKCVCRIEKLFVESEGISHYIHFDELIFMFISHKNFSHKVYNSFSSSITFSFFKIKYPSLSLLTPSLS
jgi:hypothetical protein